MRLSIGTKSVLFGAHCFLFHWFFVALGWWKLYGFRRICIGSVYTKPPAPWAIRDVYASLWNPRVWLAFFVHDIGYLGKPNMDGAEGERHPETGAAIMRRLFGQPWGSFVLYHSRFLAKQHGARPSPLCIADKLAIALTPAWLYLPLIRATGEIHEYMAKSVHMNETGGKYAGLHLSLDDQRQWHRDMCAYIRRWVAEHPATKVARTDSGVWQ